VGLVGRPQRFFVVWILALIACDRPPSATSTEAPNAARSSTRVRAQAGANTTAATSIRPQPNAMATASSIPSTTLHYAWDPSPTAERLFERFAATPNGFTRVSVAHGSFGEFLRQLPLLPEGARVVDYRGNPLYNDGKHQNIVAVVDLDIGKQDLQQCADTILRVHAEWQYAQKRHGIAYKAAAGQRMTYAGYLKGERAVVNGNKLDLVEKASRHVDDHQTFRSYLNQVFAWANTASIARDGERVALSDIAAGDYFVLPGTPTGHAVMILDVAKHPDGRLALLLGQGYMPAQSFHVLSPNASAPPSLAWFIVSPRDETVTTPFWQPFPKDSLRRLR
jgi:Domain of unknown function (4846)